MAHVGEFYLQQQKKSFNVAAKCILFSFRCCCEEDPTHSHTTWRATARLEENFPHKLEVENSAEAIN